MANITITPAGAAFNPTDTVTSTRLNEARNPTAALVPASVVPSDLSLGAPSWDGGGTLNVIGSLSSSSIFTSGEAIEINQSGTGDRNAYVDFHTADTSGTDFNARIFRKPGVNADLEIINSGTGAVVISSSIDQINSNSNSITTKAYIDLLKPNIVQAVKTNIFSILTPNMVFTDIPDLEVTITPKFSNSKILISSTVNSSTNNGNHGTIFRYVKDGSAIALGDTRGNRTPCTFGSGYGGQYTTDVAGMDYLDSASLTAGTPIVYKIQVTSQSTIDVLINEVNTDNNNDYIPSPISTLTVTEIYQ